jgi:hypothetical protein
MTKTTLFRIANQLWPLLLKHDTWYQKVVLIEIWLLHPIYNIVVTYEIRVFFEGAQKEVFSSIFKKTL